MTIASRGAVTSKRLAAVQVAPPSPHPPPCPMISASAPPSSYQTNWRQAFGGKRTMGPRVEWHLRLNGFLWWEGRAPRIPFLLHKNPPHIHSPPHPPTKPTSSPKSLFLCPPFYPMASHSAAYLTQLDPWTLGLWSEAAAIYLCWN